MAVPGLLVGGFQFNVTSYGVAPSVRLYRRRARRRATARGDPGRDNLSDGVTPRETLRQVIGAEDVHFLVRRSITVL